MHSANRLMYNWLNISQRKGYRLMFMLLMEFKILHLCGGKEKIQNKVLPGFELVSQDSES